MAGWIDPRPNDFSVEGLRARFKSLQDWLRNPEFANGVRLGDGTPATYDDTTGVTVPPTLTDVDAAVLAGMDQDLTDLRDDLDQAEAAILAAEGEIDTLNTVTIPALDGRLSDAEDDIAAAQLEIDGILPITETKIEDGAISTPKIQANAVTANEIAAGTITANEIATGTITAAEIAAGTITTNEIAAGTIVGGDIAADTITGANIAAGTITSSELAADSVTANELAAMNIGVGKWIASTAYTPGSDGWVIDADGTAEFNDVTVRGRVVASEFRGTPTASILGVNGSFDTDTSGWTAYTAEFPNSQIARVTSPVRSGSGALRIDSSSGAGVRAAYTEVTVAPGDIVHAAGWVLKDDVSDNAAETWWDTVTINVDFYDGTGTLVHQYFNESIQAAPWFNGVDYSPNPEWRLLEVYAAAPLDRDVTKARIYFSSYSNAAALGKFALYVDDVSIGIAPMLEVPYMVTHEDTMRKRALVTPQQFAFESQFSNYPYGMRAWHNAHAPSLVLTGPYGFGNQAPQLELEHDLLNNLRLARFSGDQVIVPAGTGLLPGLTVGSSGSGLSASGSTLEFIAGGTSAAYFTSTGRFRFRQSGTESTPTISTPDNSGTGLGWALDPTVLSISAGGAYVAHFRPPTSTTTVVFPNHATSASAANCFMASSGNFYRSTSSGDIKRDVEELDSSAVADLRPVTFKVKPEHVAEGDDPDKEFVGFIAEEVAEADPRLAQRDEDGKVVYFDTNGLMAHIVKELQTLRQRVADLEANVDA